MSSPSPPPAVVGSPINPDGSKEVSSSPLSDLDSNDDGTAEEGEDFYPRTSDGFGEMRDSIARSSAESTRFSFVAMDLEPGISKTFSMVVWSIPCILVILSSIIAAVYGSVNAPSGFSRDVMTYAGSMLSIIGALAVFISDKYMTHWKLHPNPLIYWKMVADFLLAIVAMFSQAGSPSGLSDNTTQHNTTDTSDKKCPMDTAMWVQFCLLSSETWFFVMALDLFFSLRNPFTSYKKKYPRYHVVCWGMAFISMIILWKNGLNGTSTADICWVIDDTFDDNDNYNSVWVRNRNAILFLYMWMVIYFVVSIVVYFMTVCRINGGLRSTYKSRRHVLERTSKTLLIFMFYWFVMGNLYYFGLFNPEQLQDIDNSPGEGRTDVNNIATGLIWALLPGKGFVTAIVWFTVNSLPSFIFHSCTSRGREILRRKQVHFVGGDFSPQLNQALRKEVLHFTTKGIIEAVSKNPNRPPANWGMNVLVKKDEVLEFDIELEDKDQAKANALPPLPVEDSWWGSFLPCCSIVNQKFETVRRVKFKDYCPHVFARIRAAFGVTPASYVRSLKSTCKEKLSEGASGAFMFFTKDGKYIVKSTSAEELECLLRILVPYAEYLVNNKNKGSFLTRFYGCHSIKMYGRDYSFVVMANVFNTKKVINQKYDIKGSWVSRHADPIVKGKKCRCRNCNRMFIYSTKDDLSDISCTEKVGACEPNVVLKDNDLNEKIRLEALDAEKTIEQLVADSELLGSLGIMDYSLIMGVCNTEYEVQDHKPSTRWPGSSRNRRTSMRQSLAPKVKKRTSTDQGNRSSRFNSNMSSASEKDDESIRGDDSEVGFDDANSTKRYSRYASDESPDGPESEFMMRSRCVVGPEFVYMGVIDMLQEWTMKKKVERFAKTVLKQEDSEGISAIEPNAYMRRFQAKIRAIFEVEGYNVMHDGDIRFSLDNDLEKGLLTEEESKKSIGGKGRTGRISGGRNNGDYSNTGLGGLTHV